MHKIVVAGACFAAVLASTARAAVPASPLNFRELEYQQPRDPLTGSNPAFVEVHHASVDQLAGARAAIETALPVSANLQDSERLLHLAGARCWPAPADAGVETCTYRDAETVDEYVDDVVWTVRLTTTAGKVASLALDRAWQRH